MFVAPFVMAFFVGDAEDRVEVNTAEGADLAEVFADGM